MARPRPLIALWSVNIITKRECWVYFQAARWHIVTMVTTGRLWAAVWNNIRNYCPSCIIVISCGSKARKFTVSLNCLILQYWSKMVPVQWHHVSCVASEITSNLTICYSFQTNNNENEGPYYWLFVRGIHQWWVDSSYKGPMMSKTCLYLLSNFIVNSLRQSDAYICW